MSAERVPCCVPFCRRTLPRERFPTSAEVICAKCFARAALWKRREYRRLFRREKRGVATDREKLLAGRLWDSIKRQIVTGADA